VSEPVRSIHTVLGLLARRERGLLSGQALAGALGVGALVWLLVVAAFNLGWARPSAGWLWVGAIALAALIAAVWPLRGFGAARDLRRQAGRLEAAVPELRGELLTVLDRTERPLGASSLVDRLAAQVEPRVRAVPAARVVPAQTLRRAAAASLVAIALLALSALVLPAGPLEALSRLVAAPSAAAQSPAAVSDGPRALVGDITFRYLYPTYTGLEPLEVPNASGDVHAPPGTRVEIRARTAVEYPSAVLEVYERSPEAVPITGGRDLATAFTVEGPGVWRFRFGDLPSPDYRIVPDPDLAPDVTVQVRSRGISRSPSTGPPRTTTGSPASSWRSRARAARARSSCGRRPTSRVPSGTRRG
jgi:hypothetical protein